MRIKLLETLKFGNQLFLKGQIFDDKEGEIPYTIKNEVFRNRKAPLLFEVTEDRPDFSEAEPSPVPDQVIDREPEAEPKPSLDEKPISEEDEPKKKESKPKEKSRSVKKKGASNDRRRTKKTAPKRIKKSDK